MKNILYTIAAIMIGLSSVGAQPHNDRVVISEQSINAQEEILTVSFNLSAKHGTVKPNYVLTMVPVLTDGNHKVSFKPIVVEGRRAGINRQRYELASGHSLDYGNSVFMKNGNKVLYSSSAPVQPWMQNAELILETELSGCCSRQEYGATVIASNILVPLMHEEPTIEIVRIVEYPDVAQGGIKGVIGRPGPNGRLGFVPISKADTLSITHSFIVPENEYDPKEPFKVYDQDRETSLIIYFRQGQSHIDHTYFDNAQTVSELINAVNLIQASDNSRVKHVVVAGFASPEGSFAVNDRLAFERAVSVKEYIVKTTDMSADKIKIFNGSVDWRGLRFLVENSRMPEKKQVLDIIDNTPIWDSKKEVGRLGELMRLNGGSTYRYMYREFFPKLRNGAFIKVYYENN